MLPILNLNKHPKDCKNLSLINAKNVKLSNDGSCLQSENSININSKIHNFITSNYEEQHEIIALIPCNTELIIIAKQANVSNYCDIFRYNEKLDEIKLNYANLKYCGGTIKGAFTYNVNGELILSISEYNDTEDIPLRTLNLGKFEEDKEQLPNELLSINPEVIIPTLSNYDYLSGNLPKGWYYIFIRYKIDNVDYTKWFDIGGPILVSTLEKQSIFKLYGYMVKGTDNKVFEPFTTGALDHFNSSSESSNETLDLHISDLDNRYTKYQIGLICTNNTTFKSYKTSDIDISVNNYIINYNLLEECDYNELIIDNINFYNAKNLINYENRLYISNYKEKILKDYDTSNIKLTLKTRIDEYDDIKTMGYSSLDGDVNTCLNVDTEVPKKDLEDIFLNDTATAIIYPNLEINGGLYNTFFEDTDGIVLSRTSGFTIRFVGEGGIIKDFIQKVSEINNYYYVISKVCKIKTTKNNVLDIQFYLKQPMGHGLGTGFFKYNVDGKTYITNVTVTLWDMQNLIINCQTSSYNAQITNDILIPKITNPSFINSSDYLNTKNSFDKRRKNTTLIPGEIYNFYIHFVDKYGFSTNGFKLKPKPILNWTPVAINFRTSTHHFTYLCVKPNINIFNDDGTVNLTKENCHVGRSFVYKVYEDTYTLSGSSLVDDELENLKNHILSLYGSLVANKNIKWEDISVGNLETYIVKTEDEFVQFVMGMYNAPFVFTPLYLPYYNKNNEELFKIPHNDIKTTVTNATIKYQFTNLTFDVENVEIPDGYVGYFLSYEKFEETCKCTGILSKYDFNNSDYVNNNDLIAYNKELNTKMYFYCSDFDILDSINLKYNVLRVERKNIIKASNNQDVITNSILQNVSNLNVIESTSDTHDVKYYSISDYNICIAGDPIKNRFGLGTCLELPIIDELFEEDAINIYKASLLHIDNNNYTSEDKELIKCTNIIYPNENNSAVLITNLNGKNTYNSTLIYDANKFIFNSNTTQVEAEKGKKYIDYGNSKTISNGNMAKFLAYVQIPCYKEFFYETKSFKQKPENVAFKLNEATANTDNVPIELGCIVQPINTISLFENKFTNIYNLYPKIYKNNRIDIVKLEEFNKFIRRSDVIQNESLSNSWRNFRPENYKIINENKGNITNIVGIGTYLLVHTEHSIFLFNNDNVLKTEDKNVQLEMPDIFTMDYKELITSDLGYCGLQDDKAFIVDKFGYIFYDNDAHRIYKFDNGQINTIDDDIQLFLLKYKPSKIRFANDKESDRLLLNISLLNIKDGQGSIPIKRNPEIINLSKITLSYNYKTNSFISFHDYDFSEATNTKNVLYLIDSFKNHIYNINYKLTNNVEYNIFENGSGNIENSQLDFIINDSYINVKLLEYILYKLYKINLNKDGDISYPVGELRKPYSGEQIRVYNDEVDTGWLDIKIDVEEAKNTFGNYEKPHWNLGNWNFSYLRNKLSETLGSDFMSRLYGNYFIVSIKFGDSIERVEFESLRYNISKDKIM